MESPLLPTAVRHDSSLIQRAWAEPAPSPSSSLGFRTSASPEPTQSARSGGLQSSARFVRPRKAPAFDGSVVVTAMWTSICRLFPAPPTADQSWSANASKASRSRCCAWHMDPELSTTKRMSIWLSLRCVETCPMASIVLSRRSTGWLLQPTTTTTIKETTRGRSPDQFTTPSPRFVTSRARRYGSLGGRVKRSRRPVRGLKRRRPRQVGQGRRTHTGRVVVSR